MLYILRIIALLKYLGKLKFYTENEKLPNDNIALSAGYYLTQTNPAGPTEFYVDYIQKFMEKFKNDVNTVQGTLSSPKITSGQINQSFQRVNNKFLGAELKPYQIDIAFTPNLMSSISSFYPSALINNTRKIYVNIFIF